MPFILLYTYLWAHGFTLEQISKETNLPLSTVEEWNETYCEICHSLYQRNIRGREDDLVDGNVRKFLFYFSIIYTDQSMGIVFFLRVL